MTRRGRTRNGFPRQRWCARVPVPPLADTLTDESRALRAFDGAPRVARRKALRLLLAGAFATRTPRRRAAAPTSRPPVRRRRPALAKNTSPEFPNYNNGGRTCVTRNRVHRLQ